MEIIIRVLHKVEVTIGYKLDFFLVFPKIYRNVRMFFIGHFEKQTRCHKCSIFIHSGGDLNYDLRNDYENESKGML